MKRIVYLLALCGFVLAGCDNDTPASETQVTINLSISQMANADTKSATEDMISKFVLYGVDDKNAVVKIFPVSNQSLTGIIQSIPIEVKTIYAIANPTSEIENATLSDVSDLQDLTANFTSAPQSPFFMGGMGAVSGSNANIELIRAVAKVEFIEENGFEIVSVAVSNTPNRGYIFKKATIAPPSSSTMVNYTAKTTKTVYVAENSKNNPTEFLITGKYLDKEINNYPIFIKKDGALLDIARNACYKVFISATPDLECTVTISITEWDEVDADEQTIPDEVFEP